MTESRVVYLIRHAIAEEAGPAYPDDAQRPLTARGRARFREVAQGLVACGVVVDEIVTSPFVRARQTADILAAAWTPQPLMSDLAALAVGEPVSEMVRTVRAPRSGSRVAFVGHMPSIGALAAGLLGAKTPFDFKKGAVMCLELGSGAANVATLLWFAPPRLLRLVGRADSCE